jgi:hypothetical protein
MKLTQEQLAAYLPYRVMVEICNDKCCIIIELNYVNISSILIGMSNGNKVKLLLHPIESITKEIEWNGEIINPFDEICRIKECAALYSYEYMINNPLSLPYDVVQILLSMHIDIFNLTKNNLTLCKK